MSSSSSIPHSYSSRSEFVATSDWNAWANMLNSVVTKTANYTATNSDRTIKCITNSFTVTLPTAVGINGKDYNIKVSTSGISITVATTSSQTIDDSTTKIIAYPVNLKVQSDGSNWIIV